MDNSDSASRRTATRGSLTAPWAARERRDLHRLFIDQVRDYAIFALDPDGFILTWNAGAERLTGYRPEEIIGQHFSAFYQPEGLAAGLPEHELRTATEAGSLETEGWRLRKDGSAFWATVVITALFDDDGELLGFTKITRDLTERRQAEAAVRASEERFRLLVQSVQDYAIFMLDPGGHIATWNEGAQRIKGYSEAEITGKHFSIFYPGADVANDKPARELAIAVREGSYSEEGWRVRKDGSWFWASVVITRMLGSNGELAGFAKVTRDLTGRVLAERLRIQAEQLRAQAVELERRTIEAETANRAKGEFLAAMSHELRTPLNAIAGYVQLLELGISGPLTDEQRNHLERIDRSQRHLLGIINDILNYSRIEAGQVPYDIGPVSASRVVEAVLPMVVPQAQAKGVRLTVAPCGGSVMARADEARVEQILVNLLANAVKFTAAGGEIEVACGEGEGRVWIAVRDSGVGIPLGHQEAIFAPFVQVGRRLANPQEGTGLGLSISRELARAMKGDLTVESREGVGSVFRVVLPRA